MHKNSKTEAFKGNSISIRCGRLDLLENTMYCQRKKWQRNGHQPHLELFDKVRFDLIMKVLLLLLSFIVTPCLSLFGWARDSPMRANHLASRAMWLPFKGQEIRIGENLQAVDNICNVVIKRDLSCISFTKSTDKFVESLKSLLRHRSQAKAIILLH